MGPIGKRIFLAILIVTLGGCATKAPVPPEGGAAPGEAGAAPGAGPGAEGEGAQATPIGEGGPIPLAALEDPESPLSKRVILFEFDSAQVAPEYLSIIEAHGNFIAQYPQAHVRLEGHADERGSREYNIGLGDRRAQSVRRLLLFQGAAQDQIETISYGEERPVAFGHDEAAYAQNRRVEIIYEGP
jgi:peptidoglycan-associated lipoprotein